MMYAIFSILLSLSIFSCDTSGPADSSRVEEAVPASIPADTEQAPAPQAEPEETLQEPPLVSNIYSWISAYDPESCIHSRIQPPSGFRRKATAEKSFASWLRGLPLKPAGSPVYLYNGEKKYFQGAHHAVINMDVGTRDLQQCADAVMRLKAEYHYGLEEYADIHFNFSDGTVISFDDWRKGNRPVLNGNSWRIGRGNGVVDSGYSNFKKYLTLVFGYAGTASLEKELQPVAPENLQSGDVFIRGGYPGHAVIVVDVVESETREKRFLLAQSYMPAQEMHVLRNPENSDSPWYSIDTSRSLHTPEWTFEWDQLKRFEG
ncbi:MAG: DUF4846 domain-containing protein [Bacteroidetes bacterium]|nr:DUF4846 domain-containing protein [Bacteroidota bacterium]